MAGLRDGGARISRRAMALSERTILCEEMPESYAQMRFPDRPWQRGV